MDSIKDDFKDYVDGLDTIHVTVSGVVYQIRYAKRFDRRNAREAVESLGLYIQDFVEFTFPQTYLQNYPELGSTVITEEGKQFVVIGVRQQIMTNKYRLRTVSLDVVAPETAEIYEPLTFEAKAQFKLWKTLPVRLVLSHQSPAPDDSAQLEPSYRAYVRTSTADLPFPERARLKMPDGKFYEINSVEGMDKLAGFCALSLTESKLGEVIA